MVMKGDILLRLDNVSLGYDKVIYEKIDASASAGEMIAVVGANGMGKSTLLRAVSGILGYMGGQITILERLVESYSPAKLARHVSFVPSQSLKTRNLSLTDMVATGCYGSSDWLGKITPQERVRVVNTIKLVGLEGFEDRDSASLSDGEFQRAAIARSLVQNSDIILLDEPTAFLDIENKVIITKLLKEIALKENKSVIYSTHDLIQAIKLCDKIWILGQKSFFEGDPQSLIEKGAFDQMFKDPSFKFSDYTAGLL